MEFYSIFRNYEGNESTQKTSSIAPIKTFNDRETHRQQKEVNHSILKEAMHKWSNVDDEIVENNKVNKNSEIEKPGQSKPWVSNNEYFKEGSFSAGIKHLLNKTNENQVQVYPDDRHLSTIEQLQKERANRQRHEQMMSKCRISHKIKSKNFHRHQKKRSMQNFLKNEETAMQENGDHLKESLLVFEKMRAEERISLKHKVGGKFAKIQKLRAKYDPNAREALSNMRDKGKELTKRSDLVEEDDEEIEEDISEQSEEEVTDDSNAEEGSADEEMMAGLHHTLDSSDQQKAKQFIHVNQSKSETANSSTKTGTISTSQSHFLNYDEEDTGDLGYNDESKFKDAIYEIYQGDEQLAEQFAKEKADLLETENPKDLQTFVPGFGCWTGPGLEAADKRRLKRGLVKAPDANRKDKKKARVWIKEGVSEKTKKHLITRIPYPYNTVEQFNLSRQQLVSSSFNLQTVHRKLCKPKFEKKSGEMIYPRKK